MRTPEEEYLEGSRLMGLISKSTRCRMGRGVGGIIFSPGIRVVINLLPSFLTPSTLLHDDPPVLVLFSSLVNCLTALPFHEYKSCNFLSIPSMSSRYACLGTLLWNI